VIADTTLDIILHAVATAPPLIIDPSDRFDTTDDSARHTVASDPLLFTPDPTLPKLMPLSSRLPTTVTDVAPVVAEFVATTDEAAAPSYVAPPVTDATSAECPVATALKNCQAPQDTRHSTLLSDAQDDPTTLLRPSSTRFVT
jgi:hypothetical protein